MLIANHVAIIGGGFSGTLMAINLLHGGARAVTLIERAPARLGRGLAYGAAQASHVLNVRAANMSAFPDAPEHFTGWLARRGAGSDASFATRTDYGAYLAEQLAQARAAAPGRLTVRSAEAIDLDLAGSAARVTLGDGTALTPDVVILASGNLPPHDLPGFGGLPAPCYISDPWLPGMADGLRDDDIVLLLGTGLTAVDCALTLDRAGFGGRIVALSRRGLLPHRHAPEPDFTPLNDRPGELGADLIHAVRARARAVGWRNAVDELRPFTSDIWRAAGPAEQARFLRHLRPFWDVHRHRLAPQVGARIEALMAQGRLEIAAGKIESVTPVADGLELIWRIRGSETRRTLAVRRAINCTGRSATCGARPIRCSSASPTRA